MLELEGPGPPYRRVAADLRRRINSGEWSTRLPSEKTFAQEYGYSLQTIRKAFALLRDEGLIETARGWGSSVLPRREDE